ncbi:MAG: restriction endonuclease subunit S [Verrucomicrobiae bacterium]|nr:restriction endonuclease subunit S [Verrucomicrobiae bacterium]
MTEAMKTSGVDWIGNIPSDWSLKKIRFATTIRTEVGKYTPENVFIGLENVEGSTGRLIETESEYEEGIYDVFRKGDVLFSKLRPYLEKAFISDFDGFCTGEFVIFRGFEGDKRFLFYFLLSHGFIEIVNASTYGAKMPRASWDYIKNLNMPLPCSAEQQAIAAFLYDRCGQIDVIVADLERQVEILRQYKKALITETVTKGLDKTAPMKGSGIDWIGEMPMHWEMKRLKFLGSARNGLTYAPENVVDEDKGTLVLRSSNIQNDRLTFDDNVYVNCRIPKEIVLQENDLLICSRNGSQALIGKCALIDEKTAGQTYGAFMCVYRSRYNKFIHYVFLSDIFSYYLGTFLTSTVNQLTNLNLYNIQIPIPMDLNEQQAIVEFLDHKCAEVDDLIAEKQKAAETMRQYKKSLIYEYVTGKKRVTG